jgi:hypothetical protein
MPQGAVNPDAKTVSRGVTPLDTGCGAPDTFNANGAAGGGGERGGAGGDDEEGAGDEAAGAGALAPSPPPHEVRAAVATTPIDKLNSSAARCFTGLAR